MILLMWNLMNKINQQTKERQTHREQADSCQRGGRLGSWVRKVKKLSKTKQNSQTQTTVWGLLPEGRGWGR